MSHKIIRWRAALSDLNNIADYILKDSPESAIRFLFAAENAFALLAESPEMGTLCNLDEPSLSNVRLWTIKGFRKYVVFYRPIDQGIEIIRVVHGSRDFDAILNDI